MSCACDFCSGKKDWNDNWCVRCAQVKMAPPKWWEDMDVCDQCEREIGPCGDATSPSLFTDEDEERAQLIAMIPKAGNPDFTDHRIARGDQ